MLKVQLCSAAISAASILVLTAQNPARAEAAPDHSTFAVQGAGSGDGTASARVDYGDLDLTTKAGQIALRQRVQRTAAALCHQLGGEVSATAFTCEDRALKNAGRHERAAIARAGSPALLAEMPKPAGP